MSTTLTLKPENTPAAGPAAGPAAQTLERVLAELAAAQAALVTSQAETAEAVAKAAPATETPVEKPEPSKFAPLMGKRTWLKTVHGDMTNLHTNEVFTTDPKKATVDQFILNQLDAGKIEVHVETDD